MKRLLLLLLFTGSLVGTKAQPPTDSLPGDTSLPSSPETLAQLAAYDSGQYEYSVADYFQRPPQSYFRLSPDGTYLSYLQREADGKRNLYIKNTETDNAQKVVEEDQELIRGYAWANDERLVYVQDQGGDENYHLFAVDLDGKNPTDLTPFEGVRVELSELLKEQPDHMIVEMNKENPQVFEPYRINIETGELTKLFDNSDVENPIAGYNFDKDGNLRAYTQQQNGTEYVLYYRTAEDQPFAPVLTGTWQDNFYVLAFDYTTDNPHDAYVTSNLENNTQEIVRYDLAEKKTIDKIYANDTFDVSGLETSRKRNYEVDYYYYTGEKERIVPVSGTYTALHQKFQQQFGNEQFSVASVTDDEDKYLLYVTSDRLYGTYHTYDVAQDTFQEVMNLMPQLNPEDMAEMRPITFTSRDGLTLYGYLTVPQEAQSGERVPLIVNPHGGPYGPRDAWGFSPEAQLFASRGYATLQINYRGSGGYGKEFFLAGSKQIGRRMLDDLEDGVAYVKSLDMIDEDRIAIYGGSYGGLATLGSLVKTPDLYTCGVDYVGVSNLFTFYKSFPPYWKPYLEQMYEQWYDERDSTERKIIEQVSPALNVDKITKPLLVVQGANDPRVNIHESDQVVQSLRERGVDVPYMVKYDEGHGFGREENRIDFYRVMMGFWAKHLKSARPSLVSEPTLREG